MDGRRQISRQRWKQKASKQVQRDITSFLYLVDPSTGRPSGRPCTMQQTTLIPQTQFHPLFAGHDSLTLTIAAFRQTNRLPTCIQQLENNLTLPSKQRIKHATTNKHVLTEHSIANKHSAGRSAKSSIIIVQYIGLDLPRGSSAQKAERRSQRPVPATLPPRHGYGPLNSASKGRPTPCASTTITIP